ncbi:MAG: hypothetical protein GDA53_06330 [Rhodobacteraceae bacterium]|nr:hypothetical protein [Paracoccaceae bacterium]
MANRFIALLRLAEASRRILIVFALENDFDLAVDTETLPPIFALLSTTAAFTRSFSVMLDICLGNILMGF